MSQLVIWSGCCIKAPPHTILISHEYLAVKNFVIPEHVVNHLFIQTLWGSGKRDLHATGLLDFEVDIAMIVSVSESAPKLRISYDIRRLLIQPNAHSIQLGLE